MTVDMTVDPDVIANLVRANLTALRMLYDSEEGTFNHRICAFGESIDLPRPLDRFGVVPFNLIPLIPWRRTHPRLRVELKKDLKHIGHACVGILWQILVSDNWCTKSSGHNHLALDMVQRSLSYLSTHQTAPGYLEYRYVYDNGAKEGCDSQSIAETTNSFIWASATASNFVHLNGRRLMDERLNTALGWPY